MADVALDVASAPSTSIHSLSARADSKAASQYRAAVIIVNKVDRAIHAVSPQRVSKVLSAVPVPGQC